MNDLEWLARHVHEWPKTDSYAVVWHEKGRVRVLWDCGTQNGESFTRDQWLAERARLQKLEPRPEEHTMTKKEWRGPEDGLPPIGADVEYRAKGNDQTDWDAAKVCGYVENDFWVILRHRTLLPHVERTDRCEFRPLRTEEDRAVEDMMRIWTHTTGTDGQRMAMLYRKGYRKQEPSE